MPGMNLWMWLALAVLLMSQNFSFTVVSRARNSGSDLFHAFASVFSNGIWVLVNVILFKQWQAIWDAGSPTLLAGVALFYITCTVIGSVYGGKVSRRFFERGKRKVGHYDKNEERLKAIEANVARLEKTAQHVVLVGGGGDHFHRPGRAL